MAATVYYQWEGTEYAFEEKGADWYWSLGIIAIAGIVACIIFNNFLLALVVAAAATSLGLVAARAPRTHQFALTDTGLVVDQVLHPYEEMLHFSILEYADESLPPSISIKTKRLLAPHILIPIVGIDPLRIYDFFLAHVPEGEHDKDPLDHIIRLFRL